MSQRANPRGASRSGRADLRDRGSRCPAVGLALALVGLGCAHTAPIYRVDATALPPGLSIEATGEAVARALLLLDWQSQPVAPTRIEATKERELHQATIQVRFDASRLAIDLVGTERFKQTDTRIHRLYNRWIRTLEATILQEVQARLDERAARESTSP